MTRPRSPGRPTGESQLQRERLLDAATDAFARIGIHAASLRGIAQQAGVTPALVNYYFGNKERLVDALVEERLLPLFQGMAERLQSIEGQLNEIKAMLTQMSKASGVPASNAFGTPMPPRTKRPPSEGEQK